MDFDTAFERLMGWEGGGTLHFIAGDPGGATRWGVSQRSHPDIDVATLSKEAAKIITWNEYWRPVQADVLPDPLQWDVFDFAFNAGTGTSVRALQRSVNLCKASRGQSDYLVVDGDLGPVTLKALWKEDHHRLTRVFRAYRARHYLALANEGPATAQFIHGWLRRAEGGSNG